MTKATKDYILKTVYMVRIRYFFWAFTACLFAATPTMSQPTAAYHVGGRCHDYGSALGLKASVYAVIDGVQQKLGECQDKGKFEVQTGIFDVLLPVSASHLVLMMPGYRTVTIPVQFTPDIPAHARFTVSNWAEMTALDSLPKPTNRNGNLALFFDLIDSLDVDFTLRDAQNPARFAQGTHFYKRPTLNGFTLPHPTPSGTYVLTLTTTDGQLISSENVTAGEGLTFKSVRVVRPADSGIATNPAPLPAKSDLSQTAVRGSDTVLITPASTPLVTAPSSTTLYFDQSSHDLRTQTRTTLDSIAQVLVKQPDLIVTVTGYSDNVGQRDLNVTLSEYRARIVETYLRQHNVPANRIVAKGQGPDVSALPTDADSIKAKSRRVVVQVAPK